VKNEGGQKVVIKTRSGADRYWELTHCLKHARCPLSKGVKDNLTFLIELRHEIEHRSTNRIDDAVSAKLQACCINFNDEIKRLFGLQYGLERRLPIALQFVTFSAEQRAMLRRAGTLPPNIETMMNNFHSTLTAEEQADPRFAYRVALVPKAANRASGADMAIEFVAPGSEEAAEINRILLKEVEKRKYLPSEIVRAMQAEGYNRFTMDSHTRLWKRLDAKDPKKGCGAVAVGKQWSWYDSWLNRVREECQQHPDLYRSRREINAPNSETRAATAELEEGAGKSFDNVADLVADLNAEN